MATAEELKEQFNPKGSNLENIDQIAQMGTGDTEQATLVKGDEKRVVDVGSQDAQIAFGEGFVLPGADGSIGADVLKDEEEIDFEEAETPMPIVPEVEEIPEMELTPSEEKEVGLMDEISGLYEETLGRTAYRTGLEEQAGLPQMQETQRDLQQQLKILANEAKQETLRIQDKPISNTMIKRQTEKMTRQNTIKALGLNSLLEASRGNISTATALVDRAVSAKYDPIEEEIAVKERNLQALRNSPQATIEDRNRAMEMEVLLDEQRTALADARAEKEVVMNLAIEAQMNGADSALTTAIQEADTRLEALEIGGELLVSGGWKYVSTPAERDRLIAQGYEITQTGGRTYMREPQGDVSAEAQALANRVLTDKDFKLSNVPADMRAEVAVAMGDTSVVGGGGTTRSGGGTTDTEKGGISDFDYAREIVVANPDASPEQLKTGLLEEVNKGTIDLSVTEINALVAERKKELEEKKEEREEALNVLVTRSDIENQFTQDELYDALNNSEYASFWKSRAKEAEKFFEDLRTAGVTVEMIEKARNNNYTNTEILEAIMKKTANK